MSAKYSLKLFNYKFEYTPKEYLNIKKYNKRHENWRIWKHWDLNKKGKRGCK